ncbi:hypothetical protein B0T14DRAFT_508155 [Immersiella caudata]|uniref:Uncharacterized protein n=1 Tax=Immersiella caudata TaxID=314043 RepID=A0AA39XH93_9PEZI|nr:hypothetical protein B0T14DRAFT_508155 [Immersiella caudata]
MGSGRISPESLDHQETTDAQLRRPSPVTLDINPTRANPVLRWRPPYLRRSFLALFAFVLLLVLASTEVLLVQSQRHSGIANAKSSQHYLWTFGPTAFLTLLAVLWARVDHQSKLVAPWLRLSREASHPSRTLQLDYLSDFLPWSVPKAIKNKDFIVSVTSAVSVLLKVLVIISTGLITLSWTPVSYDSYPMVAQSVFRNSNAELANSGTLAYYMMSGHRQRNLTYPDGLFGGYAFQPIQSDAQSPERTNITVDAFRGSLDCQPTELILRGSAPPVPQFPDQKMNLTLTDPECRIGLLQLTGPNYKCDNCTTTFARYAPIWCDGSGAGEPDRERRIFVMFGSLSYVMDRSRNLSTHAPVPRHPYVATLHRSGQLLCIPKFDIGKVEVVRDRANIRSVTPIPSSFTGTLDSVSPWEIATAHFNVTNSVLNNLKGQEQYRITLNVSDSEIDVDSYMELAVHTQLSPGKPVSSLYDINNLHQLAEGYYQQSTAIIAKQALMEPASLEVRGTATVFAERLLVQAWAAHWMAGILGFCSIIILVALLVVPSRGILPCNPSTIHGMASLIQHSDDLVARLEFSGTASDKHLGHVLQGTQFHSSVGAGPMAQARFAIQDTRGDGNADALHFPQFRSLQAHPAIVHPATRTALCVVLAGLVIALELLLRKSAAEDGLGDEEEGTSIHYTWTAIPAIVFGAIAMIISAMEFRIRCLAPYVGLTRRVDRQSFMSLDLLDMSLPRLLYREIRMVNIGALAATLALLAASFFTIFSPSLFHTCPFPVERSVKLQANQSFSRNPERFSTDTRAAEVSSLILTSNYTYGRFTYEDLAFPQLVFSDPSATQTGLMLNGSSVSIDAVIPAVRARLHCQPYDRSQIRTNLTFETSFSGEAVNPLQLTIEGKGCLRRLGYDAEFRTNPETMSFGLAKEGFGDTGINGCSDLVYIWGKMDYAADPIVRHVAALGCNLTMEAVDVDVRFSGTALDIDNQNPPRPRENTARVSRIWERNETSRDNELLFVYGNLVSLDNKRASQLTPFFQLLTASPWAVPEYDLGDPSADEKVREAIKFQNGIIIAQSLAFNLQPANISNATFADPKPGENDAQLVFDAVVTRRDARRRVIQDALSTRVLEGLLGGTLLLLVASWIFMRKTAVLASSPTSIASRAALIAGGNLLSLLPGNAQTRRPEEIATALGERTHFRMGWWAGVGGVSRFGIFVAGAGDEDAKPEDEWAETEYRSSEYAAVGHEVGGRSAEMSPCRLPGREESK